MRKVGLALVGLTILLPTVRCHDSVVDGSCPSGGVCGYYDHRYASTFYCPPAPLRPGGWQGYVWRDQDHCRQECDAAASWGCNASECYSGCENDTGSGQWRPCDEANGGVISGGGCFLATSGVRGETVPCACQ